MIRTATWMVTLALVSASSASAIGPRIERYSIDGYLDRAPEGSRVVGSVRVGREGAARTIVVTTSEHTDENIVCSSCDSPLQAGYPFVLVGDERVIRDLLAGAEGAKVSGVFTRTRTDRHLIVNSIGG